MMNTKDSELISIIVPIYNVDAYIGRCLDSLLAQSYANIEIICVDDGSTDNSLQVLKQYEQKDSRVRVFHQENAGVSAARNRGIMMAQGEYLSFIDADDWVDSRTYELVASRFSSDIDLVSFGAKYEYDDKPSVVVLDRNGGDYTGELTAGRLLVQIYSIWNKVVRRSLLENPVIRFPEDMRVSEDSTVELMIMSRVRNIAHITEPLYHYYQREDSAMADVRRKSVRVLDNLKMIERVWDFMQKYGSTPALPVAMPYIFWLHYYNTIKQVPDEMRENTHEECMKLATKIQAFDVETCSGKLALYARKQGSIEKMFHRYIGPKESFGIFGKSVCSIVHDPPFRTYSLLGKKLFTRRYRNIPW